ncbi:sirohydrochlorin chelatase [Chlorobium sp.]|uniref:sirohydrochlorin chelatase n=1 Tax=Chlorobium sp. TaxID=1095 RepID=UPI002F41DCD6
MNTMRNYFGISLSMGLLALICLTACDSGEHQSPNGKADGDESRKTALLLINHGSRSGEWKRQLLELERRVSSRITAIESIDTLATAFMEHAEPSIASSLRNLDRNGYTDVIVIPVFLSAGTHVFDDIPTIIGRKENPATIEEMKLEGIERYVPAARTHLAQPLDFSDLIGNNVLRRAQSLSRNPAEEGLVLVGYGSSEFGNIWEELFAKTGREAVRKGKFGGYATAWCGHVAHYSPDSTASAIRRILKNHERAIVIPLLVSFSEQFQIEIIGGGVASVDDNQEKVRYRPDAILPDEELERWIVKTAEMHATAIRSAKPRQ